MNIIGDPQTGFHLRAVQCPGECIDGCYQCYPGPSAHRGGALRVVALALLHAGAGHVFGSCGASSRDVVRLDIGSDGGLSCSRYTPIHIRSMIRLVHKPIGSELVTHPQT